MQKKRFAIAILGAFFTTGVVTRASNPVGYKIDIASGAVDLWPNNGDVDFTAGGVTTVACDLDGDSFPEVVAAAPIIGGGAGASLSVRKGWDGTIKGVAVTAPAGRFVATGSFSDGPKDSSRQVVVGPGAGQPGVVQEYVWSATNPDGTPSAGTLIPGRSVAPFGNNYTGGITVAAGDVDGDGIDELFCAAQSPLPPINGVAQPRVQVLQTSAGQNGSPNTWTPVFGVVPAGSKSSGAICLSGGPALSGRVGGSPPISEIVSTYTDLTTGATDLAVNQGTTPISFVDKFSTKTDVYAWGRSTLHTEGVIHRDLATRCCMADLDGDGTDEIILSGNDGAEPIVSILSLATVPDADGSSSDLMVTRDRILDLETVLRNYDSSELSSLIFNPSVTSTVFSSADPDAALADPLDASSESGTLFLTPDFVPEPTSLGLISLTLFSIARRRRTSTRTLHGSI